MSSDPSFTSRLATTPSPAPAHWFTHWGRRLMGRTDSIRIGRDPGDSQAWRKGN